MSFLGTLGKIGKYAAIGGATAFGSPAAGALVAGGFKAADGIKKGMDASKAAQALGAIGDVSSVAGKQAEGAAAGRAAESKLLNDRDQTAIEAQRANQAGQTATAGTDLERKKFLETARLARAQQALMGDTFSNYQPVDINTPGVPHSSISGGLTIGQGGKDAMAELLKQARLAQMNPDTFAGGEMVAGPQLSAVPKESGFDSFLGTTGKIGSLLGALGPTMQDLMAKKDYAAAPAGHAAPVAALAGLDAPDPRKPLTYNPNAYQARF